ncbi:murein biosynthesis integral membrane protein MurJ [Holospora curviuscula]|uniref:Putative peptidoglycan biosynthesis protein MurJ n=1 Tax=Holospora curviuscula TaxID=1082868 RepID=A0A2S5R7E0_9PROT|nr:murein biosynthesis integral membrane protein MurJ [Holospora curviuscula]PPE03220.1 putative peptidoglycan biosynthesis protein MurJ [Holospora curviuscula]
MKINFLRSVSWVATLTLLSRISGYFRELLLLQCIGINAVSDTLTILIKIPAFFRRIFAEGAMQVAFLPIFTKIKEAEGEDAAYQFSASVLGLLVCCLTMLVVIAEWKWDLCSRWIFSDQTHYGQRILFSTLGKIVFPYIFFISIHSFFGSISSVYGRFGIFNFSHTLGNLFILSVIIGLLVYKPASNTRCAYWVSWAILGSGILQCAMMIWGCWYQGVRRIWPVLRFNIHLTLFLKKFVSSVLSVSSVQLNTIIGAFFSAQLPTKGASYLNYADRFQQLPLSLIGISLTSVLLPVLAQQHAAEGNLRAWRSEQHLLRFSFMMSVWVALFFWISSFSLVACLLYPSLKFGMLAWKDLVEISHTVMIFSLTIPAYIGIKILITRCFASGNGRLPWISGLFNVGVTLGMSLCLRHQFYHLGLALASVISAWSQFIFLLYWISRQEAHQVQYGLKRLWLELAPFTGGVLGVHYFLQWTWSYETNIFVHLSYMFVCALGITTLLFGFLSIRKHVSYRHFRLFWRTFRA